MKGNLLLLLRNMISTLLSNAAKITQIVDKYLGKGKKVSEATPDQAELIHLVVTEMKEDLMK